MHLKNKISTRNNPILRTLICLQNQKSIARYIGKHPKRTLATEIVCPAATPSTIDNATTDDNFLIKEQVYFLKPTWYKRVNITLTIKINASNCLELTHSNLKYSKPNLT